MKGVDFSNHNGAVDWAAVKNAGIEFAWCKASEGVSFVDDQFARNRVEAAAKGVMVGAYHYGGAAGKGFPNNPVDEAQHFCDVVGSLRKNELRPILDFEEPSSVVKPLWARQFMNEVERLLDVRPALYSYPDYLGTLKARTTTEEWSYLQQWPLWMADYSVDGDIDNDYGFRVIAHQYSASGSIPGVSTGNLDLDKADNMNDLRESGDYMLWRNWKMSGIGDRPKGIPNTIPVRWADAYAEDFAGVTSYMAQVVGPLNDQISQLQKQNADLAFKLDGQMQINSGILQERDALVSKIQQARQALA